MDVLGKTVKLGDTVAFATAGKGASGFTYGEVVRLMNASVQIEHVNHFSWGDDANARTVRRDGCFAIVEKGENIE